MTESRFRPQLSITEQAELATNQLLEHLSEQEVSEETFNTVVAHFEGLGPCQRIEYVAALTRPNNIQSQQTTEESCDVDEKKTAKIT